MKVAMAIVVAMALVGLAQAQASYSCVNDAPNPYKQVTGWAHTPRPWAPTNNVFVDSKDNIWVMDRREDKGCLGAHESPILELAPDGQVHRNLGAVMYVDTH